MVGYLLIEETKLDVLVMCERVRLEKQEELLLWVFKPLMES